MAFAAAAQACHPFAAAQRSKPSTVIFELTSCVGAVAQDMPSDRLKYEKGPPTRSRGVPSALREYQHFSAGLIGVARRSHPFKPLI